MTIATATVKQLRKLRRDIPGLMTEILAQLYDIDVMHDSRPSGRDTDYPKKRSGSTLGSISLSEIGAPTDAELCGTPNPATADKLCKFLMALTESCLAELVTVTPMIFNLCWCNAAFPITLASDVRGGADWAFDDNNSESMHAVTDEGDAGCDAHREHYYKESVKLCKALVKIWPNAAILADGRRLFQADTAHPVHCQSPTAEADGIRLIQYLFAYHRGQEPDRNLKLMLQVHESYGLIRTMGIEKGICEMRRICNLARDLGVMVDYLHTIKKWYGILSLDQNGRYAIQLQRWGRHNPCLCEYDDVCGVGAAAPFAAEEFLCDAMTVHLESGTLATSTPASAGEIDAAITYHAMNKASGGPTCHVANLVSEDVEVKTPSRKVKRQRKKKAETAQAARDYGTVLSTIKCRACETNFVQQGVIDARTKQNKSPTGFCLACHTKLHTQHFLTMPDGSELESTFKNRDGTRRDRNSDRATDWKCPKADCGAKCWGSKTECFKCQTKRPAEKAAAAKGAAVKGAAWGVDAELGA